MKGWDKFDGQSKEYTRRFKIDRGVLKTKCFTIHSEFYIYFEKNIKD